MYTTLTLFIETSWSVWIEEKDEEVNDMLTLHSLSAARLCSSSVSTVKEINYVIVIYIYKNDVCSSQTINVTRRDASARDFEHAFSTGQNASHILSH